MANRCALMLLKPNVPSKIARLQAGERFLHSSHTLLSVQSGKIKTTQKKNKPVTYEDAFSPPHIAHRKSWNSWNTSTIEGGLRPAETAIEDLFIRKFIDGTFPASVHNETTESAPLLPLRETRDLGTRSYLPWAQRRPALPQIPGRNHSPPSGKADPISPDLPPLKRRHQSAQARSGG